MELRNYQKDLLEIITDYRFLLIKHSRDMGVTSILKEYIIKLILDDSKIHNILIVNPSLSVLKKILSEIKMDNRVMDIPKDKESMVNIIFNNGNSINIGASIDCCRGQKYTDVIINSGAFIPKLKELVVTVTGNGCERLLIASGNKIGYSYFNEIFNDDQNFFKKHKLHYSVWEDGFEKYSKLKSILSKEIFDCEIELIDCSVIKTNKDKLLSFRLSDDLYNSLIKKLLDVDLSLSDYLRKLINDDIKNFS